MNKGIPEEIREKKIFCGISGRVAKEIPKRIFVKISGGNHIGFSEGFSLRNF